MNRRIRCGVAAAALAWGFAAPAPAVDLFIAPARYPVVQVMFDVLSLRPSGFVTYQGNAGTVAPALHAWNGSEWVRISLESLQDGSFAEVRPDRIIVIGDAETLPPVVVEAAQRLAPKVLNWEAMDHASIVNAAGRLLDFSRREWSWFAGRYKMNMGDSNENLRHESWYYQSHPDLEYRPISRRFLLFRGRTQAPRPPPAPPAEPAPAPAPAMMRIDPLQPAPVETIREQPPTLAPNVMWEKPEESPRLPSERSVGPGIK